MCMFSLRKSIGNITLCKFILSMEKVIGPTWTRPQPDCLLQPCKVAKHHAAACTPVDLYQRVASLSEPPEPPPAYEPAFSPSPFSPSLPPSTSHSNNHPGKRVREGRLLYSSFNNYSLSQLHPGSGWVLEPYEGNPSKTLISYLAHVSISYHTLWRLGLDKFCWQNFEKKIGTEKKWDAGNMGKFWAKKKKNREK